jgi:hypothetical protein
METDRVKIKTKLKRVPDKNYWTLNRIVWNVISIDIVLINVPTTEIYWGNPSSCPLTDKCKKKNDSDCQLILIAISAGPKGGQAVCSHRAPCLYGAPQIVYYEYHILSKNNIVPVRKSQPVWSCGFLRKRVVINEN